MGRATKKGDHYKKTYDDTFVHRCMTAANAVSGLRAKWPPPQPPQPHRPQPQKTKPQTQPQPHQQPQTKPQTQTAAADQPSRRHTRIFMEELARVAAAKYIATKPMLARPADTAADTAAAAAADAATAKIQNAAISAAAGAWRRLRAAAAADTAADADTAKMDARILEGLLYHWHENQYAALPLDQYLAAVPVWAKGTNAEKFWRIELAGAIIAEKEARETATAKLEIEEALELAHERANVRKERAMRAHLECVARKSKEEAVERMRTQVVKLPFSKKSDSEL